MFGTMTFSQVFCAALALAVVTACSAPLSSQATSEPREIAHMQPMREGNNDTVVGFDVHGTRMDVSIDLNEWETIDDDADQAIKDDAMRRWKEAWSVENPGKHATLTVRLLDYHGRLFFTETGKV
ncbi:MAG: hypothetical protein M3R30_08980 [Candidatus Eremiobacteraeota bacterium]|nr:hypothetical protein [Candidatus Eremiobacteraeota bacterium]